MFNHARTLLMNLSGDAGDLYISDYPGDEMIPADYRAVALPTYLQVVRSRLFGVTPDRAMLNYRVAQGNGAAVAYLGFRLPDHLQ